MVTAQLAAAAAQPLNVSMAYLRDDCYVFDSGEHFHIWVRGGYDRWRESGWAQRTKQPELDSGVQVPTATMDRFVLMRLAEMVVEKTAMDTLQAMVLDLFAGPGNVGENCLRQNLDLIRHALQDLQDRCSPRQAEDV